MDKPGASTRVCLNIGGRKFETTQETLTGDGKITTFFSSLMKHGQSTASQEFFIDRDGDAFAPLLSFLRTTVFRVSFALSLSATVSEAHLATYT